ncbi:Uncharacterised protein [Mycobacteroides abscessus]|nr:Uncharacterised protein [Mycobacteroides abscessus]
MMGRPLDTVTPLSCVWWTVSNSARGTEPSRSAASTSRTAIQRRSTTTTLALNTCSRTVRCLPCVSTTLPSPARSVAGPRSIASTVQRSRSP